MTLKIVRKTRSRTVTYLVLPQAFKTDKLEDALAERKPGCRLIELTLIIKDITVSNDGKVVAHPHGEYLQSRDIA